VIVWTRLVSFLSRLLALFSRERLDREARAEMELHLEFLTEEYVRRGMTPVEARRQARLRFGGAAELREVLRDEREFPAVESWLQDFRYGARLLRKNPGFAGVVVLALALGIGVNNTAFSIVNATRLRGLPVDEPARILAIGTVDEEGPSGGVSYQEFEEWRDATRGIEDMAAFRRTAFALSDEGRPPEQVQGLYVSANAFRVLGARPVRGRDFVGGDDRPGAPPVVVLGSGVFQRRYGGDEAVVGRTILVNATPAVVVGVMPEGFQFDFYADMWLPLEAGSREGRTLQLVARLADGASLSEARSELQTFASRSEEDVRVHVGPFTGALSDDPTLFALVTAVGFVLLAACANVANLLLARSLRREREIATRLTLGATRARIVRQLLAESALLTLLAGALGYLLSLLGVRLFAGAVEGIAKPYWIHWGMDGRVYAFLAILGLVTGVLFSLAPAIHGSKAHATRTSTAGGRSRRLMGALLVTQVALALALVTGAGLLMKSFFHLYQWDRVVDTSRLTTLSLRLPETKYPTPELRAAFFEGLEERLEGVGMVTASTIATTFPFAGAESRTIAIDGREGTYRVSFVGIGSRYFETLGLSLVKGGFQGGEGDVVINDLLASLYFPGQDPIGRRVRFLGEDAISPWLTIVGIAPTVRQRTLAKKPDPTVYLPYRSAPMSTARLLVRSTSDLAGVTATLREEVRALDPDLPLYAIMAMDELLSQSRWPNRVYGILFSAFALVALSLSIVGLYAVTTVSVAERVREIGIRLAFGAGSGQVIWAVARRMAVQVGAGLILGALAALGVGRLMASFLVDTSPSDPATLMTTVVLFAITAATACLLPTWRATRLDPLSVLRHE
jgi:predicted permease